MKIIRHRELKTVEKYMLAFDWKNSPGSGYAFDCDKDGNVDKPDHPNYIKCINNDFGQEIGPGHVLDVSYSYVEPGIGICNWCGREVELDHFTNTCECGADYDSSGQELADRRFWGEETGEHLADIMRIK